VNCFKPLYRKFSGFAKFDRRSHFWRFRCTLPTANCRPVLCAQANSASYS